MITSVAALFTCGFFPILWFLDLTMDPYNADITTAQISFVLLAFSLIAGKHVAQVAFAKCDGDDPCMPPSPELSATNPNRTSWHRRGVAHRLVLS